MIDEFPAAAVKELHLGGFTSEDDDATPGAIVLIDTHPHEIAGPVWELSAHAIRRFGAHPTIVEWDADLPTLDGLVGEASKADAVRMKARQESHAYAR